MASGGTLGSSFRGAAIRVRMKGIVTKVLHTEFASVKSAGRFPWRPSG